MQWSKKEKQDIIFYTHFFQKDVSRTRCQSHLPADAIWEKKHRDDCKFHVADRLAASFVINVISAMASVSEATNFTNGVFIHIFIL